MKSLKSRSPMRWTLACFLALANQGFPAKSTLQTSSESGCELYPIALSLSSVSNAATGTVLTDLRNGTAGRDFGWLTWNGNKSRDALVQSLSAPGNSEGYVNPYNATNNELASRKWVRATGSDNGKKVQRVLNKLKNRQIVVPLWDRVDTRTKTYRVAGFAQVELLSYDLNQQDKISVRFLSVTDCHPGNDAPVVNAGPNQVVAYPGEAQLTGWAVDDGLPRNATLSFAWSKVSGPGEVTFVDPEAAVTRANFGMPGIYVLRLWASDGSKSTTDDVTITVNHANTAPVVTGQTFDTLEDVPVSVTLSGSDAENDPLTFTVLSNPVFGTLSGTPPALVYTPNANLSGTDTFTFKANDGTLDSAPATITLNVTPVNDQPVAFGQSTSTDEDVPVTVLLAGSDVEGTALTYALVNPPAHGSLSGTPPNVVYTPNANYFGSDQFTFTVDDGALTSPIATVTLTMRAVNDGPFAHSDSVVVSEDGGADILLRGSDVEGGPLTFSVVAQPGHGVLTGTAPDVRYVPAANYYGTDAFTFKVNDGTSDSTEAVVEITVTPVNDAPVANALSVRAIENETTTIALTASDVDNDPLTFTVVSGPTNGTLSGTAPDLNYVPNLAGRPEADAFTFSVSDGIETVLGTVTIDIVYNNPPVVSAGPDRAVRSVSEEITLGGSATDDGLPGNSSLQVLWRMKSGPGTVTFGDAANAVTTASFSAGGTYVLELSASDSRYAANDLVEVRVAALCTLKNLPGLVAWFTGNEHGFDVVGGREAQLAGGTSFTNGRAGSAFSFDGVNDSARAVGDPGLDVGAGTGFSIEFWVNSADVTRNARLVAYHSGLGANGTNVGVNVFQFAGNIHVQIPDPNGNPREFVASGALTVNTWTHVAVTYDRGRGVARTYIDGVQRAASSVGSYLARTTGNLHFGNMPFNANYFSGLLDEVSIYSRMLDAQDVYELFAAGGAGKCPNDLNQGPVVNAGPDLFLRDVSQVASLGGVVSDDALPPGYAVRSLWSVVEGPGSVAFADPAAPATAATFSAPGLYVLRLSADDAAIASSDLVEVRVASLCSVKDTQGLVGWWPGNANAGDVVSANHGRLAGGTTFSSGKVSSGFVFDGVNDAVQVTAHPTLDVGQGSGLTLEFWMNSSDTARFTRLIGWHLGIGTVATNFGVNVYQQSGALVAQFYDTAGVLRQMSAGNTLVSNVWTHVAVTYERNTGLSRMFVNGAIRSTANLGVFQPRTSYNLYFGNLPSDSTFFRGMLDEVSVYDRALDAQEVSEIYDSGAVGKCPADGNQAPIVSAGPNLELAAVTDIATLNGAVTDDGLPLGVGLRVMWSKLDGPGTVTFADANATTTAASFSAPGIYVLSLTADDAAIVRNDIVEVRVEVSCSAASSGLVAWWPGNGSAQEVVNNLDGRLAGGTTFASGRVSAAFSFDGANDAVHAAAHPTLDVGLGSGLTVEFWVNPADVTRNGRMVGWHSGLPGTGTNFGVNVQMLGRTVSAQIYDLAGAPHDVSAANALTNNTWTHVTVTYDRAAALGRIYINGALRTSVAVGSYTPQTSYKLFFGNVPFDPSFFRGLLDEISIYDRPLAADEVAAAFAVGAGGKCPPAPVSPMFAQEVSVVEPTATVTVDDQGRRLGMTDASGTTIYAYDAQGRLSQVSKSWSAHDGAPAFETALIYDYDDLGRFAGVRSASVNGASMRYFWNDQNQLREVFDPHSGSTTYHYDAAGIPVGYTYPDNVTGSRFGVLDNSCYDEPGVNVVCDADGNRARRTVTAGSRTVTTYYVVSPLTVTGAGQLVEELTFDSADPLFATPAVTRVYVQGLHTISHEELASGAWQLFFFE